MNLNWILSRFCQFHICIFSSCLSISLNYWLILFSLSWHAILRLIPSLSRWTSVSSSSTRVAAAATNWSVIMRDFWVISFVLKEIWHVMSLFKDHLIFSLLGILRLNIIVFKFVRKQNFPFFFQSCHVLFSEAWACWTWHVNGAYFYFLKIHSNCASAAGKEFFFRPI